MSPPTRPPARLPACPAARSKYALALTRVPTFPPYSCRGFMQILLGYVPVAVADRDGAVARSRSLYYQFCDEMVCATPGTADTTHDHVSGAARRAGPRVWTHAPKPLVALAKQPLSDAPSSQWQAYFKDTDVLKQIDRDVRRTMPSLSFFQSAVGVTNAHALPRQAGLAFNLVRRIHGAAAAAASDPTVAPQKRVPPPTFPVGCRFRLCAPQSHTQLTTRALLPTLIPAPAPAPRSLVLLPWPWPLPSSASSPLPSPWPWPLP